MTDGTFYTWAHTNSTFKLVDADLQDCEIEIRDFGHVALYMAVAIDTRSTVYLTGVDPFQWQAGVSYQIVFINECDSCEFDPTDCVEKNRNDFHFNRKVVKVPSNRLNYGLRLKEPGKSIKPDFCHTDHEPHRFSDEAPCMGSGYGQTPGFP